MELKGQIEEIIYQNEINGYTVCTIKSKDESITAVGYLPFINIGDTLKIIGNYIKHPDYGEQFKIETFEKCMPETTEALEKYLAGGVIKGVGAVIAKRIVDTFKEETIYILKNEPERLSCIKGITKIRALEISEEFNEKWELWQIVGFLERFGVSTSNCKKVYDELGKDAIEKIEENPYVLIDIVQGIDFKQIDKMAMNLGLSKNNEKRIESAIKYAINITIYNGHTCVLKENLISYVAQLLEVEKEDIENAIINLNVKKEIVLEQQEDNEWIYLYSTYTAEENIAKKIIGLSKCENIKYIKNCMKKIKEQEKLYNIELSEKQKEAINEVNNNNVCVITGGPGTGKTTIIKNIIEIYKANKYKVVLCAPTGRAAKRMSESTGEEAKTIHRLLEIGKIEDEATINQSIAPIDADVIIIDEMSMVDLYIMNYILKGIYMGTKLVLVGDENQLPSVGPGAILKDIIASKKVPVVSLNKIFRQAAKSKIVVNAHNVNKGINFVKQKKDEEDKEKDFFYINEGNQRNALNQILTLSNGRLKKYGNYDFFENIQILTPTKKGLLGTKELNAQLQNILNPQSKLKQEKKYGDVIFRVGDKIMQIKNNYDIVWEKSDGKKEQGRGVFNGEFGRIEFINEVEKIVKINFDDNKTVWYTYSELEQIEHAYAITIHKSQGSEFDVVILVLPKVYKILLTRNLLYTALTRAKKLLVVIGEEQVIEYMIKNEDTKKRNTGLEYKLRNL